MSDDENRGTESLVPSVGGEIVARSTLLVRRGLDLLGARQPTEDATTDDAQDAEEDARAAEQGDVDAQYALAVRYESGWGVPKDDAQAVVWYRKAAEHGHVDAQFCLAGVVQEDAQALLWYRKAAEQGHAHAQYWVGFHYDVGRGVSQDYTQAAHWFRKAAEQGDKNAQYGLGSLYASGRGVPQDEAQAAKWFLESAEQGDTFAQGFLGTMYNQGRGVPQDYVEAHKWMNLAAARTFGIYQERFVEGRDAVAKKMTPDQLAEARKRANEWSAAFERWQSQELLRRRVLRSNEASR
jgi:hypothetical protein